MPDKKPWWEQEPGETLPDYIKRVGETVKKKRYDTDKAALDTAKYIATIPNRAERDINNIGKSLKSEADKLSIKLGNKNFKNGGASGGGGGGKTRRVPTPAKPGKRPPTGYKPPTKGAPKSGVRPIIKKTPTVKPR
jgi:hypothetical protein